MLLNVAEYAKKAMQTRLTADYNNAIDIMSKH